MNWFFKCRLYLNSEKYRMSHNAVIILTSQTYPASLFPDMVTNLETADIHQQTFQGCKLIHKPAEFSISCDSRVAFLCYVLSNGPFPLESLLMNTAAKMSVATKGMETQHMELRDTGEEGQLKKVRLHGRHGEERWTWPCVSFRRMEKQMEKGKWKWRMCKRADSCVMCCVCFVYCTRRRVKCKLPGYNSSSCSTERCGEWGFCLCSRKFFRAWTHTCKLKIRRFSKHHAG